ncbi:MAG: hypothetical protein WDO06_08150 [Actinomycetota bacterium]
MNPLFKRQFSLVAKVVVLAGISAILLLLCQSAFAQHEYVISAFLFLATVAFNYVYLFSKAAHFKFFLPGILFLIAFVIAPNSLHGGDVGIQLQNWKYHF